jgi:hypothetical protein
MISLIICFLDSKINLETLCSTLREGSFSIKAVAKPEREYHKICLPFDYLKIIDLVTELLVGFKLIELGNKLGRLAFVVTLTIGQNNTAA